MGIALYTNPAKNGSRRGKEEKGDFHKKKKIL
jgi:hypothetical protein